MQAARGREELQATLTVPPEAQALVVFAYGSGSSRMSSPDRSAAQLLQQAGFATLLLNLLTEEEEARDTRAGTLRFDVPFLAKRLVSALQRLRREAQTRTLRIGLFGIGSGGAAALVAAAARPEVVEAVACHGGRPDLVDDVLEFVRAPTLFIVGENDAACLDLNQTALRRIHAEKELVVISDARQSLARLTIEWFGKYLAPRDDDAALAVNH